MPDHMNPIIQLLLTGNEIMSGDTVDSNSSMIALRLTELGLSVKRKVTVGDETELLLAELEQQSSQSDVLIVNGGLGPTIDDLTAELLARACGVELVEHEAARDHVLSWCEARGAQANAANLKQALLPEGASIVPNAIGSAVGFSMELNDCLIICTPGVPSELRLMMNEVLTAIESRLGARAKVDVVRLQTFGLGESTAQQIIADSDFDWPDTVELGFRAGAPQMEVKLTTRDANHHEECRRCQRHLYTLFGDHIIGEGETRLPERVLSLLAEQGKTLTTAESCTGGLIASLLTQVPGSSSGFHAGFVTYANDIKASVLGVSESDLETEGAVSDTVARQMALGAMDRANADYAIAVSGIAGPDGGSEDKPVGTVWIAWGSRDKLHSRCLLWPVERTLFQTMIAAAGLDMIRRMLLGIDGEPRYFRQRSRKQD